MIAEAPPQRKHDILDAACRVIARDGVARMRVADVAREAGVSTALVHYYFESRGRLIEEAFARVDDLADAVATADFPALASGRERLEHLLSAWSSSDPAIRVNWAVWNELWQQALRDELARRSIVEGHGRWLGQIRALLDEGRADGSLPASLDSAAAARRLAACVDDWGREMLVGMRTPDELNEELRAVVRHEILVAEGAA